MTFILTLIGFIFAVSWLPFHLFVILTDVFFLFQARMEQMQGSKTKVNILTMGIYPVGRGFSVYGVEGVLLGLGLG